MFSFFGPVSVVVVDSVSLIGRPYGRRLDRLGPRRNRRQLVEEAALVAGGGVTLATALADVVEDLDVGIDLALLVFLLPAALDLLPQPVAQHVDVAVHREDARHVAAAAASVLDVGRRRRQRLNDIARQQDGRQQKGCVPLH